MEYKLYLIRPNLPTRASTFKSILRARCKARQLARVFDCTYTFNGVNSFSVHAGDRIITDREQADAARRQRDPEAFKRLEELKSLQANCDHDWQEQPGEPPFDVCPKCGGIQR